MKRMVGRAMIAAVALGGLMVAGQSAQAQGFGIGVRFGYPPPPPPVVRPVYPRYDRFAFERRQEFLRHEEWLRAHRFERPYGYR